MQQIGRYQITGELGRGAMGIVYRALDPTIGRTVAIKAIRLDQLGQGTEGTRLRDRLFREAQSAGVLSHANIVTIYDIAEIDENAYIFMEYVNGPSLDKLVRAGQPLDRELLITLLRQIASALDYAHSKGIVHRDIKPPNILVHEGTTAKIADFGVAKIQSQQMTQTGAFVGTPNYMSPEQIQGEAIDGRADQFSLGVVAYELLTGEKPFVAESMPTLLFKIIKDEPLAPERLNPTLGPAINGALQRAMSKNPEDRYPDCRAFISALQAALAETPGWQPLEPGSSLSLPTMASSRATEPSVSEAPVAGEGAVVAERTDVPPASPVELPPARRPVRLDDVDDENDEERAGAGRRSRRLWVIAPLCLLIGAGIYLAQRTWSGGGGEEIVPASRQAAPTGQSELPAPTQGKPEPAASAPVPAAPEAPTPAPEPTKARTKENGPPERQERKAAGGIQNFQLVTIPSGAKVVIDNEKTCQSPCSISMTAGRHSLVATVDGYRPSLRSFELPKDGDMVLTLSRITGRLYIKTDPDGARVLVNGQAQPSATPTAVTLPIGDYRIEIAKSGYKTFTTSVSVKDGSMASLDVTLASQ